MKLLDNLSQIIPVQVGIDLSCGNGFVAQHFLNSTKVGSSFYLMGRERMAEGMRTDILIEANVCC